jgi:uncharacterized protein YidB (DUF937 family)
MLAIRQIASQGPVSCLGLVRWRVLRSEAQRRAQAIGTGASIALECGGKDLIAVPGKNSGLHKQVMTNVAANTAASCLLSSCESSQIAPAKINRLQEIDMSRGMPSMTALLGMLALAGYQNRDKLMEMFNSATGGLTKSSQGGGAGGLLGGSLSELLEQFTKNGQGEAAESWIGPGPNKEIAPPELKQAIGQDVLAALVKQTGLSQEEILARLSRDLPTAVDRYTPDGRLPPREVA